MDMSYYAVQFDTARELVANNNPEGVTGLYAILASLLNSNELNAEQKLKTSNSELHAQYPVIIVCVYLVFFTTKQNLSHHRKIISRVDAYVSIQEFKQKCFKEITELLQNLLPQDGIEWRFDKK
jgi:hypothetical protein